MSRKICFASFVVLALLATVGAIAQADPPFPRATPLLSAEDGLIFEDARSSTASPIDAELLGQATANFEAELELFVNSPQAAAERADSREAFQDLTGTEAKALLAESFGPELGPRRWHLASCRRQRVSYRTVFVHLSVRRLTVESVLQ